MKDSTANGKAKSATCAEARFQFDETGGGPEGKQACVEVCPVNAIQFTRKIPIQEGNSGYIGVPAGKAWAIGIGTPDFYIRMRIESYPKIFEISSGSKSLSGSGSNFDFGVPLIYPFDFDSDPDFDLDINMFYYV